MKIVLSQFLLSSAEYFSRIMLSFVLPNSVAAELLFTATLFLHYKVNVPLTTVTDSNMESKVFTLMAALLAFIQKVSIKILILDPGFHGFSQALLKNVRTLSQIYAPLLLRNPFSVRYLLIVIQFDIMWPELLIILTKHKNELIIHKYIKYRMNGIKG
jgi:hypothetical protein